MDIDPIGFLLGPLLSNPFMLLAARHRRRAYAAGTQVTMPGLVEIAGRLSSRCFLAVQRESSALSVDALREPRVEQAIPDPTGTLEWLPIEPRHEWRMFPVLRYPSEAGDVLIFVQRVDLLLLRVALREFASHGAPEHS